MQNMLRKASSFSIVATVILAFSWQCLAADKVEIHNGQKIHYDQALNPQCDLFLRHQIGDKLAGYNIGDSLISSGKALVMGDYKFAPPELCRKYRTSKDNDVIYVDPDSKAEILKKDLISLDEMPLWTKTIPFRARFSVSNDHGDADDDDAPSWLPFNQGNKVMNYIVVDSDNYEVDVSTGSRTGYRFYSFMDRCYLATEKTPRLYKYVTLCAQPGKPKYSYFSESIDTTSLPWVDITTGNTVDQGERMPGESVEVYGALPVKPLIYSDYPIDGEGRITQGRAMCMADCAPGMLLKLLRKGQSIWGASGKPPAPGEQTSAF